jgi:hypothetical protein
MLLFIAVLLHPLVSVLLLLLGPVLASTKYAVH